MLGRRQRCRDKARFLPLKGMGVTMCAPTALRREEVDPKRRYQSDILPVQVDIILQHARQHEVLLQ